MGKKSLIVNLIGAPGTGKSTLMAQVFSKLKWDKVEVEMVSEFAKDLIWADRKKTFKDEGYIFAKQNHRLYMVNGQVDVIITDRPLFLTIPYIRRYGNKELEKYNASLERFVIETFNLYDNINFFLHRTKPYNPNGRNQTEEESREIHKEFLHTMGEFGIIYYEMLATSEAADEIVKIIKEQLQIRK